MKLMKLKKLTKLAMHPSQSKEHLRASIKERLERYPESKRHAESRSVCRRILESLPSPPLTLCAYFPLKDEVDLRLFLKDAIKRGYSIFLPCFEDKHLVFRKATDLQNLPAGAFRIPEPPPEAEVLDPKELNIALVPGRAFDRKGNRLGRGNGGYDKWISEQRKANPETQYWGVALECQIVDTIPTEAHDEKLDAIVTARGLLKIFPNNKYQESTSDQLDQ